MQLGLACVASGLFAQNAGKSPKYVSERILAAALVTARFQVDADAKSKTPGESFVSHRAASLASFLQAAVQAFTRRQVHTSLLFLHFLRESPPESLIRFIKGVRAIEGRRVGMGPMSAMAGQLPAFERAPARRRFPTSLSVCVTDVDFVTLQRVKCYRTETRTAITGGGDRRAWEESHFEGRRRGREGR